MEERRDHYRRSKSPGLAALFSALIPGTGYFYLGNAVKGFSYIAAIAALIVMIVNAASSELVIEIILFGLLLSGVYMYQIFDSFNSASRVPHHSAHAPVDEEQEDGTVVTVNVQKEEEKPSLIGSLIIIFIGVYFQLINLDYLELSDIDIVFPAIMILIGLSIILGRSNKGGNNE